VKNKILFALCLYFFLIPSSIGKALDAYEWAEMPRSLKFSFVKGWWHAGSVMFYEIPVAIRMSVISRKEWVIGTTDDEYKKIWRIVNKIAKNSEGVLKEKGLELFDLTIGQIVDTIDKVYSDPRVKTWEIAEIMPLVRGRLKEGWTEKDLDEVIAYLIRDKEILKKMENYESRKQTESEEWKKSQWEKFGEEIRSLEEPKVLKALRAYKFE